MSEVRTHNRPDRLSQLFQVCSLLLEKNYLKAFQFEAQIYQIWENVL